MTLKQIESDINALQKEAKIISTKSNKLETKRCLTTIFGFLTNATQHFFGNKDNFLNLIEKLLFFFNIRST